MSLQMNRVCENMLPAPGADIHPFMPRALHQPTKDRDGDPNWSPLGRRCFVRDVSLHDRPAVEEVYAQMRQEELLPRK